MTRVKVKVRKPDVRVENEGTIVLVRPLTTEARAWIDENVQTEPWQWFGGGLAVEPRYAHDLVEGMQADGLTLAGRAA